MFVKHNQQIEPIAFSYRFSAFISETGDACEFRTCERLCAIVLELLYTFINKGRNLYHVNITFHLNPYQILKTVILLLFERYLNCKNENYMFHVH